MAGITDPAVYRLSVPVQVDQLRATRKEVDSWLAGQAVAGEVRHSVLWVLDAALSSAIDQRDHGGVPKGDTEAEFSLHVDSDVVVLTATDHFEWSKDNTAPSGALAREWRTVAGFADRISLLEADGPTTVIAIFDRRG